MAVLMPSKYQMPDDSSSDQVQPPEAEDKLIGLTIDEAYKLTKLLRHEAHSDVYSVASPAGEVLEIEARAFELEDIPPKLRAHRLRNIKRLASRTIVEIYSQDANRTVIVYQADTENSQQANDTSDSAAPGLVEKQEQLAVATKKATSNKKIEKVEKTSHQRETARIRQHERRKANRQRERQSKAPDSEDDAPIKWETDDDETLYSLLHLAHDERSDLHKRLRPDPRAVLDRYLATQTVQFKDANELEAFMLLKYREVLFLKRQLKKLPSVMQRRHDEFGKILLEQALLPRGSKAYEAMQNGVKIAQHRLKAIRHVNTVLPGVIAGAETSYQGLKDRLKLVKEMKREIEEIKQKDDEREKLKEEVEFCNMCSREVVPGSGPYAQVVAQLQAAQARLERLELKTDYETTRLESLNTEYKNLLAAPAKEFNEVVEPLSG